MDQDKIIIRGLRQNNLKNVSLDVPKGKIVVFTGVSGSGKSSIVFDTIAAESQRQMNETYKPLCVEGCPNMKSQRWRESTIFPLRSLWISPVWVAMTALL